MKKIKPIKTIKKLVRKFTKPLHLGR